MTDIPRYLNEDKTTCNHCRWWAPADDWSHSGTCGIIHSGGGSRPDHLSARLFPVDTGAYLDTRHDFGCKLHEEES